MPGSSRQSGASRPLRGESSHGDVVGEEGNGCLFGPDGREPFERASDVPRAALTQQREALPGVSRTFALTIPQLPADLRDVVTNAYLVCRIADTIEDEPAIDPSRKREFLGRFADVVAGGGRAELFARELHQAMSSATVRAERELVRTADKVVGITRRFPRVQRQAIERCVATMCDGMAEFTEPKPGGLERMRDLDRYCYYVAGVVGEMLTELFCDHSEEIAARRDRLHPLSSEFGRGLQLVNILKDCSADRERGVCWLPRDAFAPSVDLSTSADPADREFGKGMLLLVNIAREYLAAAFEYTVLIPGREAGIRRFLLWSLGLAVLTLRRVARNPGLAASGGAKISRWQVRAAVAGTTVLAHSDRALGLLFRAATRGLPQCANAAWYARESAT